jgi:DNA-binding XRE family transcriptional regulator
LAAAVGRAVSGAVSGGQASCEVRIRMRGDSVEVEVLSSEAAPAGNPRRPSEASASFKEWLGRLLQDRGLSQETAARRIGVSLKTVNRWVRGETEPRFRELLLVCAALGQAPPLSSAL